MTALVSSTSAATTPTVSVIIATYTRAALLDECLQYLGAQRFGEGDEVVVVDNGSIDDTVAVVKRHQAAFAVPLHLLYETQPGKSHALARALAVATGGVFAFLDDDINVASGWLDAVRTTMSDRSIALMGGRVAPRWEATVADWMRTAPAAHPRLGAPLGLLEYSDDVVELGPRTVLGANMAVRREVFDVVGGFATHLGKLRGTLLSGEDHEMCLRVQAAGFRAIYVPDAVVHHWVPADRACVGYFLHWFYWSGITNAIVDAGTIAPGTPHSIGQSTNHDGRPDDRSPWTTDRPRQMPWYLLKRAVGATLGMLKALVDGRRTDALNHAIDVAFAAGYVAQRWGMSSRQPAAAKHASPEAA